MLADTESQRTSNGTSRAYANGKSSLRTPQQAGANGTHKTASLNGSPKPRQPDTYFGHDREEVTRILIQALSDMGYQSAAQSVSKDSGFELESPTVAAFRSAVLKGSWEEAEGLLFGATIAGERDDQSGNGLVLSQGADRNVMRFWVRQQKFLELLEQQESSRALVVLRTELQPLNQDPQKLHFLSSLIMCHSVDDFKAKAEWDGAFGQSRHILLSELSKCISPSVMLPEHRLAVLLRQVKQTQISSCMYHSSGANPSLYADHNCDRRNFPSETITELDEHSGEVWQVVFSHDGSKLATCGGDRQVIIWSVPSFRRLFTLRDHESGVGNVAWSWDDSKLVTCCQDRCARLWDAKSGELLRKLERFAEPVSSCVWAADGRTFITGSLDKNRSLCQWNLLGEKVYDWTNTHRVEDLTVSPDGHWLVAMDIRNHVHVYNFVTRDLEYEIDLQVRSTSVSISQDSRHLLVNQNDGVARLFDLVNKEPVLSYTGHTGGDFMIRASFGGANESFVISGSDDGYINIWHKTSGVAVMRLDAHHPRCNSVTWSPTNPCLFASCGDDGKIKIWSNDEGRRAHLAAVSRDNEVAPGSNGYRGERMADV